MSWMGFIWRKIFTILWMTTTTHVYLYHLIHRPFPCTHASHSIQYPSLTFRNSPHGGARLVPVGRLFFTPFRLKIIPSGGVQSTLPHSHKRNILQRQNKPFVEVYSRQLGLSWDRPNAILPLPLPQGGKKGSKTYPNDRGDPSRELSETDLPPKSLCMVPDG